MSLIQEDTWITDAVLEVNKPNLLRAGCVAPVETSDTQSSRFFSVRSFATFALLKLQWRHLNTKRLFLQFDLYIFKVLMAGSAISARDTNSLPTAGIPPGMMQHVIQHHGYTHFYHC